jgi:hypothetical protein
MIIIIMHNTTHCLRSNREELTIMSTIMLLSEPTSCLVSTCYLIIICISYYSL